MDSYHPRHSVSFQLFKSASEKFCMLHLFIFYLFHTVRASIVSFLTETYNHQS